MDVNRGRGGSSEVFRLPVRALVAVSLAAVLASCGFVPAFAQNAAANGQKFRGSVVPTPIGGGDVRSTADSLAYLWRVDAQGSGHIVRDDLPEVRNYRTTLVAAQLGANGGLFTSNFPIPIKGAKYITLQLFGTAGSAAADSDSVNVEIYPFVKQTDSPTDGVNEVFDMDQTDAYVTPMYFTRNQNPVVALATNTNWGRRIFLGRQSGQQAGNGSFNFAGMGAIVDDSGAPLQGEYLMVRAVNRNVNKAVSIEIDAYVHFE